MNDTNNEAAKWSELLSGKNLLISIALSGGVALTATEVYILTTMLPSVVKDIGGLNFYAWNTTLSIAASILASSLTSTIISRTNSHISYLIALVIFSIASLICGLAIDMPMMLIGRTLQGFGGGLLFALCYVMIHQVYAQKLWPLAMGLISGMFGIATLLGPAIGGIFAELDAWREAFIIVVPISIVYAIFVWVVLPRRDMKQELVRKVPLIQLLLLISIVLIISIGSIFTKLSWNIISLIIGTLLLICFIYKELNSDITLLPKNALKLKSPLLPIYISIGLLIIGMNSETFVPYFLQIIHNQRIIVSGYLAVLMALGWTIAEILSSTFSKPKIPIAIIFGPILVFIGMITLAITMPIRTTNQFDFLLVFIIIGLLLVGFGIGLGWPHILTRLLKLAPKGDEDTTSTSITTVQLFAMSLGSSISGMLANLGGFYNPGGIIGTSRASLVLFSTLSIASIFAIITAKIIIKQIKKD